MNAPAWTLATLLALQTLSGLAPTAHAQARGATDAYDAALVDYEIGHYREAYAVFVRLADAGHAGAARHAYQMQRLGRTLYGVDFGAQAEQRERWGRLCGCAVAAGPASTTR